MNTLDNDLSSKVALVTGAGRGIGRAIAERLGAAGALVVVNYARNADAAEQVVSAIKAAGGQAFALRADIADAAAVGQMFRRLDVLTARRKDVCGLDILVNSVGIGVIGDIEKTTINDLDAVFRTNVRGTFLVSQHAISRLRPEGRIINISSAAARRSEDALAACTMSKAAIESLTMMLARHLGPRRITVNALAPGWVETDINAEARKVAAPVDSVRRDTVFGQFGRPDDIADVVAFLVSRSGSWVTGQLLEAIDGYRL